MLTSKLSAPENPFNPITNMRYDLPEEAFALNITIYDMFGNKVKTLVDGKKSSGFKSVQWNAKNKNQGHTSYISAGVYVYTMLFNHNIIKQLRMI